MSLGDITVELNLDGKDFTIGIKKADQLVQQFREGIRKTDGGIKKHQGSLQKWGRGLRDVALTLGALPFALHTLNQTFQNTIGHVITANAKMERLNALMLGLSSGATTVAEAQNQANESVEYLFELAQRTPFSIDALTDSMVKFKSVGIDPMDGKMESLIDSVAKFGGTSAQLHRASIAIQQMAGKGVVSMEELRQQLGEAVPDAMQLMARGLGVTVAELTNKVSKGIVEAHTAMNAMFNQMSIENAGAAVRMSRTWDGLMGRLSSKWMVLMKDLGDQGAFDELKQVLEEILDQMDRPAVKDFIKSIGTGLAETLRSLKSFAAFLYENIDLIKSATIGLVAMKLATMDLTRSTTGGLASGIKTASRAVSGYHTNISILKGEVKRLNGVVQANTAYTKKNGIELFNTATKQDVLAAKTAVTAARMRALSAMTGAVATGFKRVGTAVYSALGPVGLLTAGLWAIYEVYQAVTASSREFNKIVSEGSVAHNDAALAMQREALAGAALERQKLRGQLNHVTSDEYWGADRAERIAELTDQIATIDKQMAKVNEVVEAGVTQVGKNLARNKWTTFSYDLQKTMDQLAIDATNKMKAFDKERNDAANQSKEAQAEINARHNQEVENHKTRLIGIYTSQLDKEKRIFAEKVALGDKRTDEDVKELERARVFIGNLEDEIKRVGGISGVNAMQLMAGQGSGKTPIEKELDRIAVRIAAVGAKAKGSGEALAKFEEQIKAGKYDDASPEQISIAKEQLRILDQKNASLKLTEEIKKQTASINKTLVNQEGRIAADLTKLGNADNPWLKQSTGMSSLIKTIEQGRKKIQAMKLPAKAIENRLKAWNAEAKKLTDKQGFNDIAADLAKMEKETKKVERSLMSEKEAVADVREETNAWLDEWYAKAMLNGTMTKEQIDLFKRYREALDRDFDKKNQTALENLLEEWEDVGAAMDRVWASSMQKMSDSLTDFMMTGKLDFKSFLEDITRMIIQAQINKLLADSFSGASSGGGFGSILGGIGSLFGFGGASAGNGYGEMGGFIADMTFANGGVATSQGEVALRKYSKGGVANEPQIALYGEGDTNEAFVPLPDGRSIPVTMQGGGGGSNVEFNIINQTGQNVEAQETGRNFDGEKMILDVVLKNITKPGSFKNTMKGAMS